MNSTCHQHQVFFIHFLTLTFLLIGCNREKSDLSTLPASPAGPIEWIAKTAEQLKRQQECCLEYEETPEETAETKQKTEALLKQNEISPIEKLNVNDKGLYPFYHSGLEDLSKLTSLKELSIDWTPVMDNGLLHINKLKNLEHLNLQRSGVTDEGLVHLKDLIKLKSLDLSKMREAITCAGMEHLRHLPNLEHLNLTLTFVNDAGLRSLEILKNMRRLILFHTKISDRGLVFLKGMTDLEYLDISSCVISDAGIAHLHGLKNLKVLLVDDTYVTPKGKDAIQKAIPGLIFERVPINE